MSRTLVVAMTCLLSLAAAHPCAAQESVRDHDIDVEDYFSIANVLDVAVSPDGRTVAYTESRWEPPAERRNTDLWIVNVPSRQIKRLSFDGARESSPMWSPDGRHIYFVANYSRGESERPPYDGSRQVWRIAPDGGDPRAVTRVEGGVQRFDLSVDGRFLYYAIGVEDTDDEWRELRERFDGLIYGHGVTTFSEVWKLDLESWRATRLVDDRRVIHDMAVSVDGRVAMITTPDEELIHKEGWSRVDVFDPGSGEIATVTTDGWRDGHPSPFGWLNEVRWSADGELLGFSVDFDGFPTLIYAAELGDAGYTMFELPRPEGVHVNGGTLKWRGQSHDLCFIGDHRARARVYSVNEVNRGRAAGTGIVTPGDVTVGAFAFSPAGDPPVIVTSTLTDPPDIYLVGDDGGLDRLTRVNPQVDGWRLPQIQLVSWTSSDGQEVEGILELPPDHSPADGPLPMIVELHGGPSSATEYKLRFWIYGRTLMAAKGYALFSPNYRGSTGYGDQFMVDLVGRENDIEVQDILAGVDAMVERGVADPDRLAVMGWSNGGFLTNCLIASSNRFKAASSGAGVIDQVIQWGIEDTPGHVINFMEGKLPWADPEEYRQGSPLYRLGSATTPTLIHVGEGDPRVPVAHSRALYRGLKQYLQIPTELVIYPDAHHSLTTYDHRKAKMEWDLAWFARYLMEEGASE
jgi:dipeptidyl aminopeptidase/acylaminoacyl peptidase